MKRFLAFVLVAALGIFAIGCEKKETTQTKPETKTTQAKEEKTMEGTTTPTDQTKAAAPAAGEKTTEKAPEKAN